MEISWREVSTPVPRYMETEGESNIASVEATDTVESEHARKADLQSPPSQISVNKAEKDVAGASAVTALEQTNSSLASKYSTSHI